MAKVKLKRKPLQTSAKPKISELLRIFDVPLDKIEESPENPNEEDEATFDRLVEAIREDGFDEPCIVVPKLNDKGKETGRYVMVSGHHRKKAAGYLDYQTVPCVIKKGWSDDSRKIQLVRRNLLKGSFNPEKFTTLYNDLAKNYDKEVLKQLMGFTKKDAFQKVYKSVSDALPEGQRKKLEDAKENITSVDNLSSVLNQIFRDHGSDLDFNFIVFSFGGKEHHYFKSDKELNSLIEDFEAAARRYKLNTTDAFKVMLKNLDVNSVKKVTKPKRLKRKPKEKADGK